MTHDPIAAAEAWAAEARRLDKLVNNPHTKSFLDAVRTEAAHQRERWGTKHDAGKEPQDWFWLLGWLSGKAVHAAVLGDWDKAKHHTISSAAVLLNWHAHMSGESTDFRPGIDGPDRLAEIANGLEIDQRNVLLKVKNSESAFVPKLHTDKICLPQLVEHGLVALHEDGYLETEDGLTVLKILGIV